MSGGRNHIKVGERNGSRVIVASDPSGTSKHPRYRIMCDCGSEQITSGTSFRASLACPACCPRGAKRKYGDRRIGNLKLYASWVAMRRRCDPNVEPERNKRWAGRGIKVCREWDESFEAFEQWSLVNGYQAGLSLDRVDNDGDYEPSNCEWVTRSVNSKRCRAQYRFVRVSGAGSHYDEPCYGDF